MTVRAGAVYSPRLGLHVHVTQRGGVVTEVRLLRAAPGTSAHEDTVPLLERLAAHLAGRPDDFSDVPVDLSGVGEFQRRVLLELRGVKPGGTITYGELARRVGQPGASRAVGAAMARNPVPLVLPCHRVLPSDGKPGNYSGEGGWGTKVKLLAIERAPGFGLAQSRLDA